MSKLWQAIDSRPSPLPDLIVTGDSNFPIIKWPGGQIEGGSREDKEAARALLDVTEQLFLMQEITEPTRKNNILDLIFINNHEIIHEYSTDKTNLSDHSLAIK